MFADPGGVPVAFAPGSFAGSVRPLEPRPIKLFRADDRSRAVGLSTSTVDTAAGLDATFRVANGRVGDDLLAEIAGGLLDAVRISYRSIRSSGDPAGHRLISEAVLVAVSLAPAWGDADTESPRIRIDPYVEPPPAPPRIDLSRPIYAPPATSRR
jgi:hypothetical protein